MKNRAPGRIGIVTIAEDLHAHVVAKTLRERHGRECAIIETDRLAGTGGISWSPQAEFWPSVPVFGGGTVDPASLDLIWWRRPSGNPWRKDVSLAQAFGVADDAAADVVRNDCRAAYQGVLFNEFEGVWVSHPDASRRAENKLLQLQVAARVGLRIPRTLVSQDPVAIRQFCTRQPTIVKTIAGTTKTPLIAHRVSPELLAQDDALRLSPAIYQAQVEGRQHLRVHAFGEEFHTALLTCDELDWRVHLDKLKVEPYELAEPARRQLRQFLREMGLSMGVFDFKIDDAGQLVWLEVNPQGQFLFLEGMSELRLADHFARFLHTAALTAGQRQREALSA